jgi:putative redox protein
MTDHEVRITWQDGMHFVGVTNDPRAEEFAMQFDADPEFGGQGKGMRPAKMLLTSLAGCMGMDVISILRKKQQKLAGFEVHVRANRAAEHPMIYTHIWVSFVVTGSAIDPSAVARAVELSYTKYCPIANLIKPVVPVETQFEIIEA